VSPTTDPVAELRAAVAAAAAELSGNGSSTAFSFDRPPKPEFGDYSTNAAMLLAPAMGEQPRAVAERLGGLVEQRLAGELQKVDVAGPGFLNLFMSDAWWRDSLTAALAAGDEFGGGVVETPERILVEFVSANPTGPITVASARHAAYGDSLSRILAFAGDEIEREYYVNDAGGQVQRLGESIKARAGGEEPPEDGYRGEYVTELAQRIEGAADADPKDLARQGVELMVEGVKGTLERFRVHMDRFFSEHTLHDKGEIDHAIELLGEHGLLYEHDGALWLRTTNFGDDKDRVLRRSNGEYTYTAADIAYHQDKRERGYDRLIDVWGADHHGHVSRMLAAWGGVGEATSSAPDHAAREPRGTRPAGADVERQESFADDLIDDIGVDAVLLPRAALARHSPRPRPDPCPRESGEPRLLRVRARTHREHPAQGREERVKSTRGRLQPGCRQAGAAQPGCWRSRQSRSPPPAGRPPPTVCSHEAAQDFSAFYGIVGGGAAEEGSDENRIALSVLAEFLLFAELLGLSAPSTCSARRTASCTCACPHRG
jgi:arginyl-tRNA synthetase